MLINILAILFVFGVLILTHELGHFWAARAVGVRVEMFTFGFGPKLIGIKRGDTLYQIALIPFGGAVKLAGEEGYGKDDVPKPDEYFGRPAGQRIFMLIMGSVHNLVVGFLVFILVFLLGVQTVDYRHAKIGSLEPGFPAENAGIQKEDVIVSVAGKEVRDWIGVSNEIHKYPGREITVVVRRGGREFPLAITPVSREVKTPEGLEKVGLIGIGPSAITERIGFPAVFIRAGQETGRMAGMIFYYLGKLFTREVSSRDLAGPVGIAQLTTQFARLGWSNFLYFLALLSVNLGVVNLFPFPMFDGGHIMGVAVERVTGRKPGRRFLEIGQTIGFALIIMLALFVTYNDLLRILANR